MNVANRPCQPPAGSTGAVNAVLAIGLILTMLGICIGWFGATVGLYIGLVSGALAAAVCGAVILLANIWGLLEESRAIGTDSTRQGDAGRRKGRIGDAIGR